MAATSKSTTRKTRATRVTKNDTSSSSEVQDRMDEATEKGYRGETPDPYPNSAYTVAGAAAGESPSARDGLEAGRAGAVELGNAGTADDATE
jgi:hypothetical protein